MKHHILDPYPSPKDKKTLYVNETALADKSLLYVDDRKTENEKDNIRIYVPLDLNKNAILRRLQAIISSHGEANEGNESSFSADVDQIISQLEIYDQIWYIRHMPSEGTHSYEAIELVKEIIKCLEDIPDGCAECFPFEVIEELKREYLRSVEMSEEAN